MDILLSDMEFSTCVCRLIAAVRWDGVAEQSASDTMHKYINKCNLFIYYFIYICLYTVKIIRSIILIYYNL